MTPFDVNNCWSGFATVLLDDTPAIMYIGIDDDRRQVQNIAYPKDLLDPYLREWVKPDYNPVIAPGPGVNATLFRDPTTAWRGPDGLWRLLVGTKGQPPGPRGALPQPTCANLGGGGHSPPTMH
ncbi:beta-fructofuranosidase, insoluble isoenzyme 3-like [Hordeum vulgare]|nr:beta-fructofuranosidase, insoluble isoenzyme 3-like [Hordeum vulgare]